jgi:8-oxo-dGTP pyrophosphatase MutT (NUDIX family)
MTKKNNTKHMSAGIVITEGAHVLLGHVTNHTHWDLPKGQMDPGESPVHAAVRECAEETGIQVPPHELHVLGLYDYKPKKNLMLYLWCVPQMPDPTTCVCKSKFKNGKGIWEPELDAFTCVTWEEISSYCQPDMTRVLRILEKTARDTTKRYLSTTA